MIDRLSASGEMAERGRDEPADGRRVAGPCGAKQRRGVFNSHAARQANAPVRQRFGHGIPGLEFVSDVADELREHVLEGQQSGGPAELVDDQRVMRPPLAKMAEHAVGGDAFVNARDRPHHRGQRGIGAAAHEQAHEVLGVHDARRCCRAIHDKRAVVKMGSAPPS